jgi:hypothetical protein
MEIPHSVMSESTKQSDRDEPQMYAVFDGDEPQRQGVFVMCDHRARTIRVIRDRRQDVETGMQRIEQLFYDQRREARYACMWLSFFIILAYVTMAAGQMMAD